MRKEHDFAKIVRVFAGAVFAAVTACGGVQPAATAPASGVFSDVPADIDPSARYLIYLHGTIIESQGVRPTHPRFGVYEYEEILATLAERGFAVISEARPSGTEAAAYADKVVGQVRGLLAAGVPPEHVAVVGFSKGGMIAILTSSKLADERVIFVFIAACGPWLESMPEVVPHGRTLALREISDDLVGSCEGLFNRAQGGAEHSEIILHLGGGHGAFYRPHPEWVEPVIEWASWSPGL